MQWWSFGADEELNSRNSLPLPWLDGQYFHQISVIYWPSTEPSIKRCTCVNKPKKRGSRWGFRKNIERVLAAVVQSVKTGMPAWEPGCRGLGLQLPRVEQTPPRCERSAAMVERRTWVNIADGPCLHSSLTHNRTHPFENKMWVIYIFEKKCIRSLLKSFITG